MKTLNEYIVEKRIPDYLVVWETVKWKKNSKTMHDKLVEAINNTFDKTKVVVIKNLEDARNEKNAKIDANIAKQARNLASSYKRVMKYDEEKREKWIQDKIEELKSKQKYDETALEFDNEKISFSIYNDFYSESGWVTISLKNRDVDDVVDTILHRVTGDIAEHLKTINICSSPLVGKEGWIIRYDVVYCFDEEFEEELAKAVKSYGDMVSAAYDSGRYMGD